MSSPRSVTGVATTSICRSDPEWSDFVLLEWQMALELKRRDRMKAIFPVFMGPTRDDGAPGNFFAMQSALEEVGPLQKRVAPKIRAQCRQYLSALDKGETDEAELDRSITETLTVAQTVGSMSNNEAVVLHNDSDIQSRMSEYDRRYPPGSGPPGSGVRVPTSEPNPPFRKKS